MVEFGVFGVGLVVWGECVVVLLDGVGWIGGIGGDYCFMRSLRMSVLYLLI